MLRPAKILIAGALIAAPFLPPLAGVATSQASQVINGQVQLGEVIGNQTLDVQSNADLTVATTTLAGNAFSAAVAAGSASVQSTQSGQADVNGLTIINATANLGSQTSAATTVVGNTAESDISSGGSLSGSYLQMAGPALIKSGTGIHAAPSDSVDSTNVTSATANTLGFGAIGSSIGAAAIQSSQATVEGSGSVILKYVAGTATASTTAVGNNVTATGASGSAMALDFTQTMTGAHVQAAAFPQIGTGAGVTGSSTAVANNISATNQGGPLYVTANQNNIGYIRAQTDSSVYSFGSNAALAYGVGNAVNAQEVGDSLSLDNTQTNGGAGMQVLASANGYDGYDLSASATVMGNDVNGAVCSLCGGDMTVRNNQTNSAAMSATTTVSASAGARSTVGTAMAVGNSATFTVGPPGG